LGGRCEIGKSFKSRSYERSIAFILAFMFTINMVEARVEAGEIPEVETTAKYPLVDITGNAAVVKVELYREDKMIFTDYLSLYKFEQGWRIVSKIYHRM
jgi:hypothetical protein